MLQVEQVVENVGSRRGKAEAEEGRKGDQETRRMKGMRQKQGQEDQQVLRPLMHPKGFRQGNREARAVEEHRAQGVFPDLKSAVKSETRIGKHALRGSLKDGKIGKRIS